MKRANAVLIAAAILFAASFLNWNRTQSRALAAAGISERAREQALIAAPGRVEAASEELRVSAELGGRLKSVNVEEGGRVRQGELIAEIENADFLARVRRARAELSVREAELRRVENGARAEERDEARAALGAAEAVRNNADREAERRRGLADRNVVSRDEAERFLRAREVARAQYEQAKQHFELVDAPAREEERARARAEAAVAEAELGEARALYQKSLVRAPIDGVVLRKLRHAGESVSTQFDSPLLTMADDRRLRIRMEVDEGEVSKLRVGQRAYVTAEAYGNQKFWGRVFRVGTVLGRKNIRTDSPSEHIDTKILETLVELDPEVRLPLGLRVDSFIQVD